MLNSIDTAIYSSHDTSLKTIKSIGFLALLMMALLSLGGCQSAPSIVHAEPAKPIRTIPITKQSQTQRQTQAQHQNQSQPNSQPSTINNTPSTPTKTIYIDTPPPIVPSNRTTIPASIPNSNSRPTVVISEPVVTPSQNTADILTAPNDVNNQNNDEVKASSTPRITEPRTITKPTNTSQPNNTTPSVIQPSIIQPSRTSNQPTPSRPVTVPPTTRPEPDRRTPQEILLERARSNSQTKPTAPAPVLENGENVPAFRRLMQTGIAQYQNGDFNGADSTFTRAQRLAPQAYSVYYYLGQVAIKRNQPRRAEAMARRGLVVAQTNTHRRQLWQVVLVSGQMQQSARVINEAQRAIGAL